MNRSTKEEVAQEALLQHNYVLGQSAGLEEAANYILAEGADYFKRGHDKEADLLRNYAKALKRMAEERHPNKEKR